MVDSIKIYERKKWEESPKIRKEIGRKLTQKDKQILEKLESKYKIQSNFDLNDTLKIEANQYIGSVRFPDLGIDLNILPKIFEDDNEQLKDTSILLSFAK